MSKQLLHRDDVDEAIVKASVLSKDADFGISALEIEALAHLRRLADKELVDHSYTAQHERPASLSDEQQVVPSLSRSSVSPWTV